MCTQLSDFGERQLQLDQAARSTLAEAHAPWTLRLQEALFPSTTAPPERQRIAASIGLALFPDDELSCADLLRAGDAAMYQAKQLGGGRVVPSRRAAPPA